MEIRNAKSCSTHYRLYLILLCFTLLSLFTISVYAKNSVELYLFYSQGCGDCIKARILVAKLQKEYPQLKVKEFEVCSKQENRELLEKLCKAYQTATTSHNVPVIFIDRHIFSGGSKKVLERLKKEAIRCLKEGAISPEELLKKQDVSVLQENKTKER